MNMFVQTSEVLRHKQIKDASYKIILSFQTDVTQTHAFKLCKHKSFDFNSYILTVSSISLSEF